MTSRSGPPLDPIDPRYAPPVDPKRAPPPDPTSGDTLGWVLLGQPIAGALLVALLPSAMSTIASYGTIFVSLILVGVDALAHKQAPGRHVVGSFFLWLLYFPYYMHVRAQWGGRRLLPFGVVVALLFTSATVYRAVYADRTRAYVRCKAAGKLVADGFDCSIEHRTGADTVDVCWDLVLTCANETVGTSRKCGTVAPKQTTEARVPYAAISGMKGCDKLTKIEVKDLVLTVKK